MRCSIFTHILTIALLWETWYHVKHPQSFQYDNFGLEKSMTIKELEDRQLFHMQQPLKILCAAMFALLLSCRYTYKFFALAIFQTPISHALVSCLYIIDPFVPILMGYSLYSVQNYTFLFSILLLCNLLFFPITLSKKGTDLLLSNSKYVHLEYVWIRHHYLDQEIELIDQLDFLIDRLSSFMFIENNEVIFLTCAWRAISFSEQTLKVLHSKQLLSVDHINTLAWITIYGENILLLGTVTGVLVNLNAKRGFAKSAIGHIAYMMMRASVIFRNGSIQLIGDYGKWQNYGTLQKLKLILTFYSPLLTIEFYTVMIFSIYLLWLRFNYF